MKCAATPLFGSDIGNGFREVPVVAVKIPSVVLALSVRMILGLSQDDRAVPPRALAVSSCIFDANLDNVRLAGYDVALGDGNATFPGLHLYAVIGNTETDGEAKCL